MYGEPVPDALGTCTVMALGENEAGAPNAAGHAARARRALYTYRYQGGGIGNRATPLHCLQLHIATRTTFRCSSQLSLTALCLLRLRSCYPQLIGSIGTGDSTREQQVG